MVYNAWLGESLNRLDNLRASRAYQAAQKMPKQEKTRSSAFRAANRQAGFREYAMHAHAKQFAHAWMAVHLDSMTIQKLATRAFLAVQQYAFAKRGRPR